VRTLVIRPAALQDLRDIWTHIADDDPAAADRVAVQLDAMIGRIHHSPGIGHERADGGRAGYRFISVYSYMIGYEYDETSVIIIRIVHGRRDFSKLFTPP
jgi:toxin ParE1/3/4